MWLIINFYSKYKKGLKLDFLNIFDVRIKILLHKTHKKFTEMFNSSFNKENKFFNIFVDTLKKIMVMKK